MIEIGPKGRFFAPNKLDNPSTSEGNGKKEKKERGETNRRRRQKAMVALLVFIMAIHGYLVPDPNLEIRGGGGSHPDPLIRRGRGAEAVSKNFSTLRASVWPKNKGGRAPGPPGPRAPPLDPPLLFWRWFWSKKKTV